VSTNQLSLFQKDENQVEEVDSFPLGSIKNGSTFTYTKRTARKVTEYTHGLHVYPAKFIPQIPRWAFQYSELKPKSIVLDPFCGSGTTLVEAVVSGFNGYGIDINPLARLLTEAKTTPLYTDDYTQLVDDLELLIKRINSTLPKSLNILSDKKSDLHPNWEFWFPEQSMAKLLTIKMVIQSFEPAKKKGLKEKQISNLQTFYLACLSSVLKKSSLFDEKQIKVRKDKSKSPDSLIDPVTALQQSIIKNLPGVIATSKSINLHKGTKAKVIGSRAQNIPLPNQSVDHIVTSPPYLNAIDYAMAHKYSLFLLDLVTPDQYKDHCRDYIGVTERAVRTQEYNNNIIETGNPIADEFIANHRNSNHTVDKVRAYIVSEYFIDMKKALSEFYRVLRKGSRLIIVVGDNIIRKQFIPTSEIIQEIAEKQVGFSLETYFFHQLRNIRLKVPRNVTGGSIKNERVIVLKK